MRRNFTCDRDEDVGNVILLIVHITLILISCAVRIIMWQTVLCVSSPSMIMMQDVRVQITA
jgi:hypothetical protein